MSALQVNSSSLYKLKNYFKGSPLKCEFWNFRVCGSKFVKFLMSVLNWQVNYFSTFASFFIVITHNSPVNIKLIHTFSTLDKISYKKLDFETFNCSGENLPSSSCYYSNHKSVFLQILHHSLVSWKVTPLYLFSSNIVYFGQK